MGSLAALSLLLLYGTSFVMCADPRISITATDPPIDPIYNMIIQEKDKDVQLTCIVQNQPPRFDVIWEVLTNTVNASTVQVSTATRSHDAFRWAIDNPSPTAWRLRVQNVQVTDEGTYKCKIQVGTENYLHDVRELRVVQIPQISDLDTSSDMVKSFDMDAKLECKATGRPTPRIKWTRMAGELLPNGGTEFQGELLRIDRVKSDHAGIYKCTALNSAGMDQREIRLSVLFPPVVYAGTPVVKQKIGYVKEMVCNIRAYPASLGHQISWMREGLSIESKGRIEIRNIPGASNRITSILTIYGVQREDFGRYTCAAINDKGSGQVSMSLLESDKATPDRTNTIRSAASLVTLHLSTFFMLLSVCVLQSLRWGR